MIEIVIADDHGLVRSALRLLVESADDLVVVGEASHGQEAIDAVERHHPDVLVLDFMLPGVSGIEVVRHVSQSDLKTQTVIVSMHSNNAYVVEAFRSGALGFVPKDAEADELFTAIRSAAAGDQFVGLDLPDRARRVIEEGGGDDPLERLSDRERQAFYLAIEGLSNAEVAERLFISPRTAEKHRARFLNKLGLSSQDDLVRFAMVRGLLPGRREEDS